MNTEIKNQIDELVISFMNEQKVENLIKEFEKMDELELRVLNKKMEILIRKNTELKFYINLALQNKNFNNN